MHRENKKQTQREQKRNMQTEVQLSEATLPVITTNLMSAVKNDKRPGQDKKQLVIQVIDKMIDDEIEDKAVANVLRAMVPELVDVLYAVSTKKNMFKAKKWLQKLCCNKKSRDQELCKVSKDRYE